MSNSRYSLLLSLPIILCACEQSPAPAPTKSTPAPAATPAATPATKTPASTPAPAPAAPAAALGAADPGTVSVGGVAMTVPKGWKQVPPANQMRLAEIQVPDESGDVMKVCTVAISTAGGDIPSNVARWAGQMKDASGQTPKADIATKTVGGLNVSLVEISGTYSGMGEAAPRPDWTLRGAIVETPSGLLFVKMTGPASTMKASAAGWGNLVDSIRKP